MITEDYVSFETAKLLKQKGFDEPCESAYTENGQYLLSCYKGISGRRIKNSESLNFSYSVVAPTLQMALKWLREVHKLFIFISTWLKHKDGTVQYYYEIRNLNDEDFETLYDYTSKELNSFEKVAEASIKYCLEKLI